MNKQKKTTLLILFILLSLAIVLCALALIISVIGKIPYRDVFKTSLLYILWVLLLAAGIAAILVDFKFRGSRRVLKVNLDLENSHFMEKTEIAQNDGFTVTKFSKLGDVADGIPVYAKVDKNNKDMDIILKEPIHTLVIGSTGTGKTSGFVSPTIEILSRTKTHPSMVITDPKGELYTKHAATLKSQGYTVNVIDLSDVYHSTKWNPFNDIWRKTDEMQYATVKQCNGKYYYGGQEFLTNSEAETERKEKSIRLRDEIYVDIQDLIYTMCPVENKQDATWQRGARDLLFALALAFWEDVRDGFMPRESFNLYNLYRNVTDYAKGDCKELKAYFETREKTSRTRGLSNTVLVSEDRTLSSYLGDVNQYLNWMADAGIAALTSGNEIEFTEFDEKPSVLFLKIPDEKENRYKLVSLFMTQMYKALVEKATRNKELGKKQEQTLIRDVYFLLDEFGNIPKLYNINRIVTVGRSRHIFLVPVVQDFNQLDDIYGKEVAATVRSNCNIQIFIGTNDENTRKIISEACGKKRVKQVSFSENKDMSVSTSANTVPLIYPNELEHLNDPANGIIGNAIVLCLGNYPIRAVYTPLFKAKELYNFKHTEISKGAFNNFNEVANHYDIKIITKFLENDKSLLSDKQISDNKSSLSGLLNLSETQSDESAADMSLSKQEDLQQNREKEMIKQVNEKLKLLSEKIPSEVYDVLVNADLLEKIKILDELADKLMAENNFFVSVDCENVKNFILYRCFSKDEILQIKQKEKNGVWERV